MEIRKRQVVYYKSIHYSSRRKKIVMLALETSLVFFVSEKEITNLVPRKQSNTRNIYVI